MKKIFILLLCFITLASLSVCSAATIKVLDKDTDLHPNGWVSSILKFKQGTSVTLNDRFEVISGTLVFYESFRTVGKSYRSGGSPLPKEVGRVLFKPDNPITFNDDGEVISGTVAENCSVNLLTKKDYFVRFKERTFISFNNDGNVLQGTLAEDTYLRPVNWQKLLPRDENAGFLKFASGTEVFFNENGQAIKGTLTTDFKNYKAGTTILFNEVK